MQVPKWKRFEEITAKIQQDLAPGCVVTPNDKIIGKTGISRQIDISVRQQVAQFEILIVVDCKDYKRPLDVTHVEEFMGLSQDVGAHKAAMVAAEGFSEAAKLRARGAGIELYRLLDTGDHPWKVQASLPALCEMTGVKYVSLQYSGTGRISIQQLSDDRLRELYREDYTSLGKIGDMLHERWNEAKFPREEGTHNNLEFVQNPVFIKTDDTFYKVNVHANLTIGTRRFFGYVPLLEASGLRNELTGEAVVTNLKTDDIRFAEIEKSWACIESIGALAVKPVLMVRVFDLYGKRLNSN